MDCVKLRLLVKLYRIVAMRVVLQRTNQYELLRAHTQCVYARSFGVKCYLAFAAATASLSFRFERNAM